MARGFRVNQDGTTENGMSWASADFLNQASESFTLCGWTRIKGNAQAGSNAQGHVVVCLPMTSGQTCFMMYCAASKSGSPFTMLGEVTNYAVWDTQTMGAFATDTDYFWALVWNASTHQATWYWAADGAGSLSSVGPGTAVATFSGNSLDSVTFGTDNVSEIPRGSNLEVTCCKMWIGATLSSGALFSEMNSDALVDTTSGSSRSHWGMDNESDTSDDGGSSRTLTVLGTIAAPTMDPVDIQGGGGGGGGQTPSRYGLQQLENGFGPAKAAGLQGVLAT